MEYEALIETDRLPVRKGIAIDEDDVLRADIIQTLMCYDELDFADFEGRYRISFCEYFRSELCGLEDLAQDGLIAMDRSGVRVTACGRLLIRNIAMQFDRHLDQGGESQRFSKAI